MPAQPSDNLRSLPPPPRRPRRWAAARGRLRAGFSLTELLVVIGIIVLLVGLLLVALGGVRNRARQADTETIMRAFAQACEAFQLEHRIHPGVIPERVLAQNEQVLTSTENALLHLMGGYRVLPPNASDQEQAEYDAFPASPPAAEFSLDSPAGEWSLKVNRSRIGEGPIIAGKPYAPYFTASDREVGLVSGQWHGNLNYPPERELPDLIDAWGQPIIYARRLRSSGPLAGSVLNPAGAPPQFTMAGFGGYLGANELGEKGEDQTSGPRASILANPSTTDNYANFERMLRHPALPDQARGGLVLISAGPDGIYYSRADGPGTQEEPVTSLDDGDLPDAVLDEYDDIRVFGGG